MPEYYTDNMGTSAWWQCSATASHEILHLQAILLLQPLPRLVPMQDVTVMKARLVEARKIMFGNLNRDA